MHYPPFQERKLRFLSSGGKDKGMHSITASAFFKQPSPESHTVISLISARTSVAIPRGHVRLGNAALERTVSSPNKTEVEVLRH